MKSFYSMHPVRSEQLFVVDILLSNRLGDICKLHNNHIISEIYTIICIIYDILPNQTMIILLTAFIKITLGCLFYHGHFLNYYIHTVLICVAQYLQPSLKYNNSYQKWFLQYINRIMNMSVLDTLTNCPAKKIIWT